MATTITTVVTKLGLIEAACAITSPTASQIKKVYEMPPNRADALPSVPAWINSWQLSRIEWGIGAAAGPRHEFYAIHAQLFIVDADLNRSAGMATAYLTDFITRLNADWMLAGTVQQADLRGGDPTLALLEWAGKGYAGLDLFVDVEIVN